MKLRLRSRSRLATAVTVEFPESWIAFQFLWAILAVPKMPQRIFLLLMMPDGYLSRPCRRKEDESAASLHRRSQFDTAVGAKAGVGVRRFECFRTQTWNDSR